MFLKYCRRLDSNFNENVLHQRCLDKKFQKNILVKVNLLKLFKKELAKTTLKWNTNNISRNSPCPVPF